MKRRDDIREELKNIAPKLIDLNHTSERSPLDNPFDVPQGYFESLPGEVLNKIKRQNALVESLRDDVGSDSTNSFEVPAGYFDSLPDVMLERVKSEPKVIEITTVRWKNWLSVAAAVAAVLMVAIPLMKKSTVQIIQTPDVVVTETLKEVSNDELYSYLSEDVSVLHVDDVAAGLPDAKLDTLEHELSEGLLAEAAMHVSEYDDALMELSTIDLESLDIESL
jgi:hypothetical protein